MQELLAQLLRHLYLNQLKVHQSLRIGFAFSQSLQHLSPH
jgi:hypothetical protein